MRRFMLAVAAVVVAGAATAGPIVIGETLTFTSTILGEQRTVLVSTPAGYAHSQLRYPVLYLTDGDAHLLHSRGTVDFLVRNGFMPDVIIVGITNTDRTRDLTPTRGTMPRRNGPPRGFPTAGGADRFLDFFQRELIPYVEKHYRTQPMRLFAGHSFGGLFALHAFATRGGMFRGVIAASPSLEWDDDLPLREVRSALEAGGDGTRVLFVSMADQEERDAAPTRLDRLGTILQRSHRDVLAWRTMRLADEDHGSVVLRSYYWGLRFVFEGWRPPRDPESGLVSGSLADLQQHYRQLSDRLGYDVPPPEGVINQAGYGALGRHDFTAAFELFRHNVAAYPDSANVYDSFGEALEAAGKLDDAMAAYEQAVAVGTRTGDPNAPVYRQHRDALSSRRDTAPQP